MFRFNSTVRSDYAYASAHGKYKEVTLILKLKVAAAADDWYRGLKSKLKQMQTPYRYDAIMLFSFTTATFLCSNSGIGYWYWYWYYIDIDIDIDIVTCIVLII